MLRFNPIDDIPDGEQPEVGIGTTYELPTADSPNGPNLFDGTEGNGDQAKPEIYAMGLRNPSRLSIDPETDVPYTAWVGPDAGGPNQQQGPSTYENAAQIAQAGNYGWPYCMGNQQGYRDRLAGGALRTTNEAGFVSGGPAGAPIQGFYDCENLVNDSENNTGLEVLPHETGTGMDAGTARPVNLWYSRGNPGGANGCPDFPRPNGAPDYGGTPEQLCPYATASGATIMDGPVYRYDPETADPSVAWPEYWSGRWFMFDWNNNSVKHALLMDPETDQDGSQPIYADSLRGVLNWQANYMDSKFAPDGSLYIQVYQGFFDIGAQAGLYRFTYTGGGPTPGADPQWEATGNPLEVQFSNGASGGVSWEWDFDNDGTVDSTEADPLHTYEADGPHEVTLTVTYADEQTDSKTITVNPQGDDTAPPTTTVAAQRRGPGPELRRSRRGDAHGRRRRRHRGRGHALQRRRRRLHRLRGSVHGLRRRRAHRRVPLAGRSAGTSRRRNRSPSRSRPPAAARTACRSPTSSTAPSSIRSGTCCARLQRIPRWSPTGASACRCARATSLPTTRWPRTSCSRTRRVASGRQRQHSTLPISTRTASRPGS